MSRLGLLAVAVLTIQVGAVSDAYAGAVPPPISVPEPSTLAVLAAGLGVAAVFKFRKRK
jgi:PEP-CTERM motif